MTVQEDLVAQYEAAKELVHELEAAWDADGRPLTAEGGATGRSIVAHPLVVMLQGARRDVDRFAKQLQGRRAGPKPSAVVHRSVGAAPDAAKRRLRSA